MTTITSLEHIATQAAAAYLRGESAQANPYPPLDPAHAVWADCHAYASVRYANARVVTLSIWPDDFEDAQAAHA